MKTRLQGMIHRAAIVGLLIALRLIPKCVIRRLRERRIVIAHDIRHRDADAVLFVVQQQHGPAIGAQANLQRAVGVVRIKRHPFHLFGMIRLHIAIVEKRHMRVLLLSNRFADIAVAFMVINRFGIRCDMHMRAAPGIFCGHNSPPEITPHLPGRLGRIARV